MRQKPRRHRLKLLIWFAFLAIAVLLALRFARLPPATDPTVCNALARADVRSVVALDGVEVMCVGIRVLTGQKSQPLNALARGTDVAALSAQLRRPKATAVAVRPGQKGPGLLERLGKLEHIPGLRAIALSPEVAFYEAAPQLERGAKDREALAYVARALFRGAREPSASSFPPALRRVERVEVMVALSSRGEIRLWRSARGTSIARALLTATRVARERWRERESAMGGPLVQRLSGLDVEVILLEEDGTLAHAGARFFDHAITPVHGVGFDYRSDWHYLLPIDVARQGHGSASRALYSLGAERGLPAAVLNEPNVRLYRFVPIALGVSRAVPPKVEASDGRSGEGSD